MLKNIIFIIHLAPKGGANDEQYNKWIKSDHSVNIDFSFIYINCLKHSHTKIENVV